MRENTYSFESRNSVQSSTTPLSMSSWINGLSCWLNFRMACMPAKTTDASSLRMFRTMSSIESVALSHSTSVMIDSFFDILLQYSKYPKRTMTQFTETHAKSLSSNKPQNDPLSTRVCNRMSSICVRLHVFRATNSFLFTL